MAESFRVVLTGGDGNDFRPPCGALLARLRAPLFNAERSKPHPLVMFNQKWADVEIAANEAADAFNRFQTLSSPKSDDKRTLLRAHRAFLYEATELIEDYESNYRACLWSGDLRKRPPVALNKSLRNHIVVQCNRMKHNHARMGYIEITAPLGRRISGYVVLNHVDEETIGPDAVVHNEREAFSFAVELRKVLVSLYSLGLQVADFLVANATLDAGGQQRSNNGSLALLRKIAELPTEVFPSETGRHMPFLVCDENSVTMDPRGGSFSHPKAGFHITQEFIGDGVTRSFRLLKV